MAINRYDKPVLSEYISQYTPIPFDLLYAIGKANNERVDKAYNELNNKFAKWSEFRSPSAVDTKKWYDLTIGAGADIVNKLAANPDLMKTADGRSMILSFINSRPYAELSQLQLSREGLLQRLKVNQQLMLTGKFNPLWHNVDFTNYDTLQSGVYNDISPLAYKSVRELVEPYVNNLKDGFIRSDGSYDYFGVSANRTDAQVNKNMSDILSTPEAQKHIEVLQSMGMSRDAAIRTFANEAITAGREYTRETRSANEFAKLNHQEALYRARTGAGNENNSGGPFYLTESIASTGIDIYNNRRNLILSNNPKYAQLKKDLASGDPVLVKMATEQIKKLNEEISTQVMFRDILRRYSKRGKDGNNYISVGDLRYAVNDVMNNFGRVSKNAKLNDLLSTTIQGVTSDKLNTPLGKRRVISGGENMTLMSNIISDIAGFDKHVNANSNKVVNALKSGKFNNMILLSNDNMFTIPTIREGQPSLSTFQRVKVAISEEDVFDAGLTETDMLSAGASITTSKSSTSESESDTSSGKVTSDNERKEKKFSTHSTTTYRPGTKYYVLDLSNRIPEIMEGTDAEYLNQQALQLNLTPSISSGLYPDVQNEAFGLE